MIRLFIGYDPNETVAYHTLIHSIIRQSSQPVNVTPIIRSQVSPPLRRDRDPLSSTDFSDTRFLVPFMCNYEGYALFMDCDMLLRDDIAKLWGMREWKYAVQVVKHDHRPRERKKFLGQEQTLYEKKNWSSVMLFNNSKCKALTVDYVNKATGLELHQFKWLNDDSLIGEIPKEWNHLVGYDEYNKDAKNVHFTIGGPYFHEYKDCQYANEWFDEYERMTYCKQRVVPMVEKDEKKTAIKTQ